MQPEERPLFAWRLRFRLNASTIGPETVSNLEQRLHGYAAKAQIDGDGLWVAMRVVGYLGPASAIGAAAQQLGHDAANAGVSGSEVIFVSAERVSARTASP